MRNKLYILLNSKYSWFATGAIFLFATFPGKGGFEGGQREILNLKDRIDNWGFITPFVYGEWPNIFGQWRFTLVLTQLFFFWIGFYLLLRNRGGKNLKDLSIVWVLFLVSTTFASQLWRDSTLFSFVIFGFGLIFFITENKSLILNRALFFFGIISMAFGLMFKPVFAPIFSLLIVIPILLKIPILRILGKFPRLITTLAILFVMIFPYTFDKYLGTEVGITKSFPEQQPMIYDLSAMYCWGVSKQANDDALSALSPVIRSGVPGPAICGSLILGSWDNLHMTMTPWVYAAPLIRLNASQSEEFSKLKSGWVHTIIHNPREWLLIKLPFATQVLTMANSFVKTDSSSGFSSEALNKANKLIWSLFYYFSVIIDKLRFLTLGALIIFLQIILISRVKSSNASWRNFIHTNVAFLYLSLISFITLGLATIIYVAGNGRYILPFVLLVYIFFFIERGERIKVSNQHRP